MPHSSTPSERYPPRETSRQLVALSPRAIVRTALLLANASTRAPEGVRGEDRFTRGALLVGGSGAPPRANVDILVTDGRIQAIEPTGSMATRGELIDAAGMTALPGLIDSHVHFVAAAG